MSFRIRIDGIDRVKRRVAPGDMGTKLAGGLRASAAIVEAQAKDTVHVVSGRLQASLGQSDISGTGIDQSIAVGTPYGRTGLSGGAFRRSRKGGGGAVNRSDPNKYGPVEEFGYHGQQIVRAHTRRGRTVKAHSRMVNREAHPFLVPALENNRARIVDILRRAVFGR